MPRRELVKNEFFVFSLDDDARVATLVRTGATFRSLDAIASGFVEVERATAGVAPGWSLLLDARDAPARNDPAFEEAFGRARRPILARFARVAVLVRSAVGKLQVARYAREDGASAQMQVFDDEAEALAFLSGAPRASRPPR